uniref:Vitellogenin domain-containing protein n=1 Tax=Myripristis murdjan TaxID=586833 RepID=A0A667ZJC5_9TELE
DQPTCLLAKRYKTLHKYEYTYDSESLNAINGASMLKNGPKVSCKVEIEVPQMCSFIVRTSQCDLTEVVDMDSEGNPVYSTTPASVSFADEMEKHPLKVMVEGVYDVKLYPEEGETTTILNFKRGIISALLVPLLEEDKNRNMPTIHGMCKTQYSVNARQDIATDISLSRDLSRCDKFVPTRDHTSPLALISGMHYPLAQLVRSSQTCNYKFDNTNKHMTSASCTENHILVPFSHKGQYGVTNVGKQELTLVTVSSHNDRIFDYGDVKGLHMEAAEDKSAIQDKDAGLALLRELASLPETEGDRRANLFHKLVTMVRGMKAETLSPIIPEAIQVSRALTFQVLAQCGTPECSSAIMQILRTFDSSSLEVDASVFAMGLVSNPSALLINDMLEMAKYKSSKPIMYALSNVVKRFYKAEGKLTPEIHSVAEFMAAKLGDCSGEKDQTFMTLRVIGNMGAAMGAASPALRAAVIQCVNQPAASLPVQQAAIQVYRLTPVPEEGRQVLMQVLLDSASPLQKRVAAYLVLMKDPKPSELARIAAALPKESDMQAKSFIISYMTNILSSTEPETEELRQKIRDAMQNNEIGPAMDPTKFSRNYRIGSMEGNMIFETTSYLPKELMLEMTLRAFGFDIDMMEIGMEGKGFEPTVEALFGENGFFPDSALKTMYFVTDNMPLGIQEILENMLPVLKTKKQASHSLMREIGRNLNKLVRELKTKQSPEAMVYLRLFGNELGYLRTNEMEEMAYSAAMMIDSMFKMFPTDMMKALMTRDDNTIFAHYIFMDNEFFLPTATGVPLRIALSGTFTPGIKGGLKFARDMSEVTFMPSAGLEFVTRVGSHFPEYVNSGLEMHTSLFHESGLSAKLSMGSDNVKLTIPAPKNPTKIMSITNTLVAVTGAQVRAITPMINDKVDVNECTPVFAGMKYCTALQYTDAFSHETAPYFPFTGDSKIAMELHPTGEITEYTATINYELLKEGEEGRQKVDSVKMVLRAEGTQPTEARAIVKYNRRKHVITTDIQIPDYDVEAGFRLGVIDGNTKGKGTHSISLDLINKNIPELSLVGRANMKAMKEGMLQVQLLVPSIKARATVTANLKRDEELEIELESDIKVLDAASEQKITMKYDGDKIEMEIKSDVNSEIYPDEMIQKYGNDLLDMQVGESDMKVRQILMKAVEVINNYMEKNVADSPLSFLKNLRIPEMPEISLPEKLFLNTEAKAVYYLNNERFTISIPLPLGGKSTEELNFPPALTTPHLSMPQFGLEIVSMEIPIPEFFVPERLTVSVPLFGKAEVSTVMKSNIYDLEASAAAGKDVVETPSYSAKFDVKGTSPIEMLSMKFEGSGMLANSDSIKAQLKSSLTHKFIKASITITEDATITDKINLKSSSKIEATSPFGLNIILDHTGTAGINTEEISGDSNLQGTVKAGHIYGETISTQTVAIFPSRPEAKIDSSLKIDSTILQAQNTIAATFVNGDLSVVSNTKAFEDLLTHEAELSFKDHKLSLKCDTKALALGMTINNKAVASAGAGEVTMSMETKADHSENRISSLLTASFDTNGLAVNSDATVKLLENEATHKATLTMNRDGLATSGTTKLQSPLTMENTFEAGLDASRATLTINNMAAASDMKVDNANTLTITLSSLDFSSKAGANIGEHASYTQDITIDMKPYTVSAKVNNNLKVLAASFINEAKLNAELYKMDLTGSLKAMYEEEEIKHTYQISYADLSANAVSSTTGKVFGTHMSHNAALEIVGLAARITNDARFNSQPMRFDHTIRASILPFDFNLDAFFNADGDLTMYGTHSAKVYGKFLIKAQPLAFVSSHEYRASLNQQLDNGLSLESTIDNKMDTVLSPQEQRTTVMMKSKMNDHTLNQDISVYNTAERIGMEVSGTILTNILNTVTTDNQEFTISGFLKYDKNTDSHVIRIPLIEYLPLVLTTWEDIKVLLVSMEEALLEYINNAEIRAKLEALPQHVSDFIDQLNIDDKAIQLKQFIVDLTHDYAISMEDLEASLMNLKVAVEKLLVDLTTRIQHFVNIMKEMIVSGTLSETVIQKIQEQLNAIDEEYNIKSMIVSVMDTMVEMIKQIDLEKLRGSSIAFLHDIDAKFEIKATLEMILNDLKNFINTLDMSKFAAEMKRYIMSFNLEAYIEEMMTWIPQSTVRRIVDNVKEFMQDFDILGRANTFLAKMRELVVRFEVDKKIEVILEKIVELIKQFRIEETLKVVVNRLKDISAKILQVIEDGIKNLRSNGIKHVIDQLNAYIDTAVQGMKSFDYNQFVDEANEMIAKYTAYMNEMIQALEIPQKLEATRDFVNFVLSSAKGFMEQLREVKIADMIKTLKEVIDQAVLNNLQGFAEILKQKIAALNVETEIASFLQLMSTRYAEFMTIITDLFTSMFEVIQRVTADQKIVSEIKQMIEGLMIGLKKAELDMPSFTFPLTDLVVPSMKLSMDKLHELDIPAEMNIPEFTIMGFYKVQATTISLDDIKQRIIELIDYLVNFEINMLNMDAFFGDLTMNYLPAMPEITIPEMTIPEISFPTIPQVPVEKLVKTLQIPDIKLPSIPTEIMMPCFGKLYGEMKFHTPIYTINTNAEFRNSTDNEKIPQFTASLTSEGKSPSYEVLNYKLESNARIAIPKRSRVVFTETLKFNYVVFGVDHQASVALYGQSAQAQAKTTMKVTTEPYTADFVNTAFVAMEGGMSASLDTTYNHIVSLPIIDLTSEATLTQKAVVRQDGNTITLTVENVGKGKYRAEDGTHKSNLRFTITPSFVTMTFSGDTDSAILKMKQQMTAENAIFSYFKFNIRNEAEGLFVKNSLIVASGQANFYDIKFELKANHDAEFYGAVSGVLSNAINVVVHPSKFVFDFHNKGNTKVNPFDMLSAKIDLQNDYSAMLKPGTQQLNTVTMVRFNQYKIFYNFTVDNNENEAGVFVAMDGEANLDFLTKPIDIPEMELPFVNLHIPAINSLNLYEQTGLKHILTTTEQTVDMDAKIVYQKSQTAPLVDMMGLIQIPSVGNMITELSFKSAIINLNVNAGLYTEDNLVFRLGANTASEFESLKAKLYGTTSLTTKRGIKLANSLSLENQHIEGTHDSTVSVSTETFDTSISVATVAKINVPVLNLEASQNLVADTKTKANAVSTLKLKGDFNVPVIKAVGKAEADHSLKMEGTFDYISMESTTKANIDGTVLENYPVFGVLDNEANLYLNGDGLRSTSKTIADAKLTNDATKIIGMDVNENLAIEASLSRVYAVLKFTGNNEANLFTFNTKGQHVAQATIDLVPTSLTADIDINMAQPSSMGDITITEKTVVEMTAPKQKISANAKIITPVYTTNFEVDFESDAPGIKATFKSSSKSPIVFLEYDMDASTTAKFENEALNLISRLTLTHTDLTMDIHHVIAQALSPSRQTLNLDITSPTFTDVNYRYAARRDGISASISTPSTGFLGLQFHSKVPSQMSARLYYRSASAPEVDVDILAIRMSARDADKMKMQIAYNMEAPEDMLLGLRNRLPSIMSSLTMFADKYQITSNVEDLKNSVADVVRQAYDSAINYDVQMSELSIFFRNVFVQYQKTVQVLLDAAIRLMRETQFKLPGSDKMTTLPEVLKTLTSSIAAMLEKLMQLVSENMEVYYNDLVDMISSVQVQMQIGDAITGGQIVDQVKTIIKTIFDEIVDFMKHMESLDMMLEKIGETQKAIVEKSQEFVDSIKSDYLDSVFFSINAVYRNIATAMLTVVDQISDLNMEQLNMAIEYIMDTLMSVMNQFNTIFSSFLQQASEEAQTYMKVSGGKLEIDLPFPFQQ